MSAPLLETPSNPVPANAHAGWLTAPDGVKLRYARFAAEGRPLQGTVVIFTGRNECVEKYFETISDLSSRGFGCVLMDWRGQGLSDRLIRNPDRGYIDSFTDYVADIDPFFEQVVLPDCRAPFYLLAHSTGALIAMLAAPLLVNRVRRMVLSTPLLELIGLPFRARALRRVASTLHAVGLGAVRLGGTQRWTPVPYAENVLTGDLMRYERNVDLYRRHPRLGLGSPSASWIRAAFIAADTVRDPDFAGRFQIPSLIVAAGNDEVVSTPAIEMFARRLRASSLVTIDGAKHEILQEADIYREQFFAAFDAFVPGSGETFY